MILGFLIKLPVIYILSEDVGPSHLPSHPHIYPHHWNPDKQGVSAGMWGCEGKEKKFFIYISRQVNE